MSLARARMTLRAKRPETRQPAARLDICTAQEKGVVLSGLLVDERKHGLGGHTLLTLVRSKALSSEASQKHGEPLLPQVSRLTIYLHSIGEIVVCKFFRMPGATVTAPVPTRTAAATV